MPNLSKKKGRRRFNPQQELGKAKQILKQNKSDKFLKKQEDAGHSWKYGHLTPDQVMTGSDKLFHNKFIKISKVRGLADDTNADEDPYFKSQYNDDRNLTNFEDDQIFRHQVRAMNDASDIDPSDSELENDEETLSKINDNDEIFALRRNKTQQQEDELMDSSGDDIERDEDDDLAFNQNVDETVDIDTEIKMEQDEEDEEDEDTTDHKKRSSKRGRRAMKINMKEISQHIMDDDNAERKRLLAISQSLYQNDKKSTNQPLYDSDESSYYKSSEEEEPNLQDIERNKYKENEKDDRLIAEEGDGKIIWGKKKVDYYGADGVDTDFKSKSERAQYQELRDEEAIALQMRKDELIHTRDTDFVDAEMELMMKREKRKNRAKQRAEYQKTLMQKPMKVDPKFASWYNDNNDEAIPVIEEEEEDNVADEESVPAFLTQQNDESEEEEDMSEDTQIGKANIEKIQKEKIGSTSMESKIINRDHPELRGMLKELKQIVSEMNMVYKQRQKAIQKRFDDAIEDSTLFIELLRTYSSTICFYLQLKAKKLDEDKWKKHGIYAVLLKLRHRVSDFRPIYQKSMEFLNNLEEDWNRSEYLAHRRQLLQYEKEREKRIHEERMMEETEQRREKKKEKKKLKKKQAKEKRLKTHLFKKGFHRLAKEDVKLEGEDARRSITRKIFKSQGLKRYRKQGIPRVKARIKYDKKMKLWKRKGYQTFKGKLPNGRMEYNVRTNLTHSKRLT